MVFTHFSLLSTSFAAHSRRESLAAQSTKHTKQTRIARAIGRIVCSDGKFPNIDINQILMDGAHAQKKNNNRNIGTVFKQLS